MKQIRKKIKLVMHYIPSGYYDKKDKARFFISCNGEREDIYFDKVCNKTDMTFNELLNKIKETLEKEIENEK